MVKIIKWISLATLLLVLLIAAYSYYLIASFDTETLPENHGRVQSELFLGSGANQPLVVGLGGAEGGNSWAGPHGAKQRALLKENGYAFLPIAYFGTEGTPSNLDRVSLDGIHDAVMEAAQHPQVNGDCIAVMGVSRGGELALLLGSYFKEYKSVIGIVPGSAVFASVTQAMVTPGFSYRDQPLPFVPVPWSATPELLSGDLRGAFEKMMADTKAMNRAAIEVEKINGPVLLMSGTADEQWPSMEMSQSMMERFRTNQFPYVYEHIALEGGHNEHHDNFDQIIRFLNDNLGSEINSDCAID